MTIYPIGHPVRWRSDIPPRDGAQTGTLTRSWHRYNDFPFVRWDGEMVEHQQLPECIMPVGQSASLRDAWMEAAR